MLWQIFQVAKDSIINIDDSKAKGVRILFCSCSQSSYITEKAVKTFLLEPVDGRNITIKTLVKKNIDKKFIYEFEFKIKTLRNNFSLFIKALCVPNSSDSINGQSIDVTVNKVLRDLEFGDDNGGSGEFDILLDGEVKNNGGSGLVAINSKFCWLVNGPVPRLYSEAGFTKSTCRLLMYCVCKVFLRQKLS